MSPALLQRSHRMARAFVGDEGRREFEALVQGAREVSDVDHASGAVAKPCADDPGYHDPQWNDGCEAWSKFKCSGYAFSAALLSSCPNACGAPCPPGGGDAGAAEAPAPPDAGPSLASPSPLPECQRWMLEELSDECFLEAYHHEPCAAFKVGPCEAQWEGLHSLIKAGTCEAESIALSSELLATELRGRTLFAMIAEQGGRYSTCKTPGLIEAAPKACEDDPKYADPSFGDKCEGWRSYHCSGFQFSHSLQVACPRSCGLCDEPLAK